MQAITLKKAEVAPTAHVVRVWRTRAGKRPHRRRDVPSAARYKPPSKWTVAAAFILAAALHAAAIVWVEMQQAKPMLEADAPVLIHSMEGVFEMSTGAGAARARTAVD